MNHLTKPADLRSSVQYSQREYPLLRRITDARPSSNHQIEYKLTPAAARVIELKPEILLHNRLYDRKTNILYLYQSSDEPLAAVEMDKTLKPREKRLLEEVRIYTPAEMPAAAANVVELHPAYPVKILPFDLWRLKVAAEKRLAGKNNDYNSAEHRDAYYIGSDPFSTYRAFYNLIRNDNILSERLKQVKMTLEIGSGLGTISFLLRQLLPQAIVHGLELDHRLISWAGKNRSSLRELGYDVSRVRFFDGDVRNQKRVRIEDYDLVIGWFPLGRNLSDGHLIAILRRLKPGALFFQYLSASPLPLDESTEEFGFRRLFPWSGAELVYGTYSVFERI